MQISGNPSAAMVTDMLTAAGLPTADLTPEKLATFFACEADGELVGVVGLEIFGAVGLLRSLAVAPAHRSKGIGAALVAHAEEAARTRGVDRLYLLTTTAEHFFRRLGYAPISRELAPPAIQQTTEFAGLCPASAVLMMKQIQATRGA